MGRLCDPSEFRDLETESLAHQCGMVVLVQPQVTNRPVAHAKYRNPPTEKSAENARPIAPKLTRRSLRVRGGRAWPVLDHKLLAEALRKPLSHQARGHVGRAGRRETNNDAHRRAWVALCPSAA
jgi:hypothetical protein